MCSIQSFATSEVLSAQYPQLSEAYFWVPISFTITSFALLGCCRTVTLVGKVCVTPCMVMAPDSSRVALLLLLSVCFILNASKI